MRCSGLKSGVLRKVEIWGVLESPKKHRKIWTHIWARNGRNGHFWGPKGPKYGGYEGPKGPRAHKGPDMGRWPEIGLAAEMA